MRRKLEIRAVVVQSRTTQPQHSPSYYSLTHDDTSVVPTLDAFHFLFILLGRASERASERVAAARPARPVHRPPSPVPRPPRDTSGSRGRPCSALAGQGLTRSSQPTGSPPELVQLVQPACDAAGCGGVAAGSRSRANTQYKEIAL